MTQMTRRLPSADWIAFGLGILALLLSRFFAPLVGLTALAVFAPSLLRELGLLKDGDEFSRQIMYRAGFHAILMVGLLLIVNSTFQGGPGLDPASPFGHQWAFPMDSLRQYLVLVFLLSYLIQYWGPARGVFRILLGVALVSLVETGVMVFRTASYADGALPVMLGITLLVVGLAFAVRRWPTPAGYLLSLLALVSLGFSIQQLDGAPDRVVWPIINGAVLGLVFFGVTGLSLVLSSREVEE